MHRRAGSSDGFTMNLADDREARPGASETGCGAPGTSRGVLPQVRRRAARAPRARIRSMHRRAGSSDGFTMVELTIVCALIMILTAMVIPVSRYAMKRQKEVELRYDLRLMREAIDKFKQFSDAGLIPVDLGTEGYPKSLDVMVEGVDQIGQIHKKLKFLRRVPVDPMTGKAEWGLRSLQDDANSTSWGGQDVYDVYSLSVDRAIDKSHYKDW
jgi:general secretion pathway protein G